MKKIVMVDQDGVVCDKNYQITKDIKEKVRKMVENDGIIIVPNSNTPAERLIKNFEDMLGIVLNAVIAEDGAVVIVCDRKIYASEINIEQFRQDLRDLFLDYGAIVEIGDSATWIRERKAFTPNSKLFIIDGLREQTIGFYLKMTDESGVPYTDEAWSAKGLALVSQLAWPNQLNQLEYNPKYGIAISTVHGTTKTSGYLSLRLEYSDSRFYMIGDTDFDIIQDDRVILCAVANASPLLKENADFVANSTFTEGLEECLEWLISKKGGGK